MAKYRKSTKFIIKHGIDELVAINTVSAIRTFLKTIDKYDGKDVTMVADIGSVEYMLNWVRRHEIEIGRLLYKYYGASINANDVLTSIGSSYASDDMYVIQPFVLS